jgi:5-phospho-D-xylono-1,4-lactonase
VTASPVVRTVLGDIAPEDLGVTYAHEHLVIDGGRPVAIEPDFLLNDIGRLTEELGNAHAAGLQAAIDMMPADCGRNPAMLAELSRATAVHLVAATGLHHEKFTGAAHWSLRATEDELADLFSADVEVGIDARDYTGPIVERTDIRAGVIKIGGSLGGPSERDRPIFRAAAETHRRTGVPIHLHCEAGTGALEHIAYLAAAGVPPRRISLSHVDKVVDRGYHRAIVATGAFVVYDQGFRWGDRPNGTLQLLEWAAADGNLGAVMLGMDAARRSYLTAYGGAPGLGFLLGAFSDEMATRGLGAEARHGMLVVNPAAAFRMASREEAT